MENGLQMIVMFLLTSNEENQRKVNVSTFGDRGDGISYFNIFLHYKENGLIKIMVKQKHILKKAQGN